MVAHANAEKIVDQLNFFLNRKFEVIPGKRYDKIVVQLGTAGRSVFAFYDKVEHGIMKPAGWKRPAKGIRFKINNDHDIAMMASHADPYGSFLYAS